MKNTDDIWLLPTPRFSVLGSSGDRIFCSSRRGVFLDIDEPYTRRLILKAFQHPSRASHFHIVLGPGIGMEAVSLPTNCDFQWAEYERIDWSAVLAGKHKASSYCIRKGLSRKAQLAYYTHRHVCKHPDSILKTALPQTTVLDTWPVWEDDMATQAGLADVVVASSSTGASGGSINRRRRLDQCLLHARKTMEEAERAYLKAGADAAAPVWILKGSTVNKGAGIFIVHLYEQVVDICWSEPDIREWVLQRYITNPLLLGKRKFHIRAYVLAVSALRVYFCSDCLALCSGTRYRRNDTSNLLAHITNTAYQELDPNFSQEGCILLWNEADIAPILIRDGSCRNVGECRTRLRDVMDQMEAVTAELFCTYKTEFGVFSPIEGCFEHYGLDFVIDDSWHAFLLEVNPGPDFKQTGSRLQSAIENLMGSTIDIALLGDEDSCRERCATAGNLKLVYESRLRAG